MKYNLNKKQINLLQNLKFITCDLMFVTELDVHIKDKKTIVKYQASDFGESDINNKFKKLVGFSECADEDEYNEQIGIELAVSSLLKKTVDLSKDILYRKYESCTKNCIATISTINDAQMKLKRILNKYS